MANFQNWHKSINVGGSFEQAFAPYNGATRPTETHSIQSETFHQGLEQLLQIVAEALQEPDPVRLRAYGSKWSLNNAAYTKEYLVKTWGLNYCKIGLSPDQVTPAYADKADKLCFVQSGVMIHDLNTALFHQGLALKTTGASDGQRLVGAISTGTHGSAMNYGAMQDFVRGIHLVIPKGDTDVEHILIQRASDEAVTEEFAAFLDNTRIINDDALFNAAVVGFGSFGLIHGFVIETEALFQLKYQIVRFNPDLPWCKPQLQAALANPTRENIRAIKTEDGQDIFDWLEGDASGYPYFFSVTRNPYKNILNPRTFFIEVMEKIPYALGATNKGFLSSQYHAAKQQSNLKTLEKHEAITEGMRVHSSIKGLTDTSSGLSKGALSIGIQIGLESFHHHESLTPEEAAKKEPTTNFVNFIFHTSSATSPVTKAPMPASSLELGVPLSHAQAAVDCVIATLQDTLLAAPLGIRYIPNSLATLAVNQSFDPTSDITVTIELPGPDGKGELIPPAAPAHQAVFDALNAAGIPHRYHWGQQYPLNNAWVPQGYPADKVAAWKAARARLLPSPKAQTLFSNEMTDVIGLTGEGVA